MKRRTFLKGTGLVLGAGVMNAWTPAFAGKSNDTLRFASERELESLDQYYNSAREGIIMAHLVCDGLVIRDPETFEYKPLLASSWEWVDDVTLDMNLRKGVLFHNGKPFVADDVAYTLNYVVSPDSKVVIRGNVDWIKSAEKLNDHKVRIHLVAPFPPALDYLALTIPIYPKGFYDAGGTAEKLAAPIGTGPYAVAKVHSMAKVDMQANPKYFKDSPKGQPSIGKLEFRTIPEKSTQVAELMAGNLDWIWRVPRDMAKNLESVPSVTVDSGKSMRIGYIGFNVAGNGENKNPFMDRRVRRAVAHAIDREAIAEQLVGGSSQVVHAACTPSQVGCTEDVKIYDYDPDKARKLLAEAGYENGFTTDFFAYREPIYAEAMVGYLRAVGIDANLRMLTYSALREKRRAGEVPITFQTWASYSVNDVSAITSVYFEGGADDQWQDPKVINWLKEGDVETDPEKRNALYANALQRIAEEAYWLPLFQYSVFYAFNKKLHFEPSADGLPRFVPSYWT